MKRTIRPIHKVIVISVLFIASTFFINRTVQKYLAPTPPQSQLASVLPPGTPPTFSGRIWNPSSPVIYVNDEVQDTLTDAFVLALTSNGKINLKGMITSVTTDVNGYNSNKFDRVPIDDFERMVTDRQNIVDAARASGLRNLSTLTPVRGTRINLLEPADGQIDSTVPIGSTGSLLIMSEARLASQNNPLVLLAGGCLTTVADAYLLDHSIANKVLVLFASDGDTADMRDYNGWCDGWAANIVFHKFRFINYKPNSKPPYPQPLVSRQKVITDLRDSPFQHYIRDQYFVNPHWYDSDNPHWVGSCNSCPPGPYVEGDAYDGDGMPVVDFISPDYGPQYFNIAPNGLVSAGPPYHRLPAFAQKNPGTTNALLVKTIKGGVAAGQSLATRLWWEAIIEANNVEK